MHVCNAYHIFHINCIHFHLILLRKMRSFRNLKIAWKSKCFEQKNNYYFFPSLVLYYIRRQRIFFPRRTERSFTGFEYNGAHISLKKIDSAAHSMSITIYVLRRTGLVRDWRRTADPGSSRHNATPRKPVTSPVAVISCTFAPQHAADRTKVMITDWRLNHWHTLLNAILQYFSDAIN